LRRKKNVGVKPSLVMMEAELQRWAPTQGLRRRTVQRPESRGREGGYPRMSTAVLSLLAALLTSLPYALPCSPGRQVCPRQFSPLSLGSPRVTAVGGHVLLLKLRGGGDGEGGGGGGGEEEEESQGESEKEFGSGELVAESDFEPPVKGDEEQLLTGHTSW